MFFSFMFLHLEGNPAFTSSLDPSVFIKVLVAYTEHFPRFEQNTHIMYDVQSNTQNMSPGPKSDSDT